MPSLRVLTTFLVLSFRATTSFATPDFNHIAASSWTTKRIDIVGVAPDKTIWHKYMTGSGWQPPYIGFENLNDYVAQFYPSIVSWGEDRVDRFHVGGTGDVLHKYWDGSQWNPPGPKCEPLGGKITSGLAVSAWSKDRLDIVGRSSKNQYIHKAWTGDAWVPPKTSWLDLGGNFASEPATVSWGPNRLDIFGIDSKTGSIKHKYWNGNGQTWVPQEKEWEDLGGGPFVGAPAATSWGENRFDIWAASATNGSLAHLFWDGFAYQGWENLGGNFSTAPTVKHWDVGKIDIVGLSAPESGDSDYHFKSYDGSQWNPSVQDWYMSHGGSFVGQPAVLVNKGQNSLYVLGIANDGMLKVQYWDGYKWYPWTNSWWDFGDTRNPYPKPSVDQSTYQESLMGQSPFDQAFVGQTEL